MSHTVARNAWTKVTLNATAQQKLLDAAGNPITGRWLRIRWDSTAYDAANVVKVVQGAGLTDNVAPTAGTDLPVYPPAGTYHAVEDIEGAAEVALLGAVAVAVWVRVDR